MVGTVRSMGGGGLVAGVEAASSLEGDLTRVEARWTATSPGRGGPPSRHASRGSDMDEEAVPDMGKKGSSCVAITER